MRYTQEEIEVVSQNTIEDAMNLLGCCKNKVGRIRQWIKDIEYSNLFVNTSEKKLEGSWENSRLESNIHVKPYEEYVAEERKAIEATKKAKEKISKTGKLEMTADGFVSADDLCAFLELQAEGEIEGEVVTKEVADSVGEDSFMEEETLAVPLDFKMSESGQMSTEDLFTYVTKNSQKSSEKNIKTG